MKKLFLFLFCFFLFGSLVSAVECDSSLSVTPCNVTSDLTLNSGTYNFPDVIFPDAVIKVYDNVVFDGSNSTFIGGDNYTTLITNAVGLSGSNITIKNFIVEHFKIGVSTHTQVSSNNNLVIDNITFSLGSTSGGVWGIQLMHNSENLTIKNCYFDNNNNLGIRMDSTSGGVKYLTNLLIENNTFHSSLYLDSNTAYLNIQDLVVKNNHFNLTNSGDKRIVLRGVDNLLFEDNYLTGEVSLTNGGVKNSLFKDIAIVDAVTPSGYYSNLDINGGLNNIYDNITISGSYGGNNYNYAPVNFGYDNYEGTTNGNNITIKNSNWNSYGSGTSINFNNYLGYINNVLFENNNINLSMTINGGIDNIEFAGTNVLGGSLTLRNEIVLSSDSVLDIAGTIFLDAHNLILDCNGATINSSSISSMGVLGSGTTVSNCNFIGSSGRGIDLNSGSVSIINNNFNNGVSQYIFFNVNNTNNVLIENNTFMNGDTVSITSHLNNYLNNITIRNNKHYNMGNGAIHLSSPNAYINNLLVEDEYFENVSGDYGLNIGNAGGYNYNITINNVSFIDSNKGLILSCVNGADVNNFFYNNSFGNGERGLFLSGRNNVDALPSNVNIDGVEIYGVGKYNQGFSLYQVLLVNADNIIIDGGSVYLWGLVQDGLVVNNLNTLTENISLISMIDNAFINNSFLEVGDDTEDALAFVGYGGLGADGGFKISNSEVTCFGKPNAFYKGDYDSELFVSNVNFSGCVFNFEYFPSIIEWVNVMGIDKFRLGVDLPDYYSVLSPSSEFFFPAGKVFNVGVVELVGDDLLLVGDDTIINGLLNVSSVGNVVSGFVIDDVVDNIAGSKFCDYDTFTGNLVYNYSGVNIPSCPLISEFGGVSTTDFSVVSDWSSVDLVLDNGAGQIDWLLNVNLSGSSADFDSWVDIVQDRISVDSVVAPFLNGSASLVFKNVNALNENVIKVFSNPLLDLLCSWGIICFNRNYDKSSRVFEMDVTEFSSYVLDYDVVLEDDDSSVILWDVFVKVLVGFSVLGVVVGLWFGVLVGYNLFKGYDWNKGLIKK